MADKLMYPIGSFKYGTRRLMAGDEPVMMSARDQRLYTALKVVSPDKPRAAKTEVAAATIAAPKLKAAPRKRKAAEKK